MAEKSERTKRRRTNCCCICFIYLNGRNMKKSESKIKNTNKKVYENCVFTQMNFDNRKIIQNEICTNAI